MPVVSAGAASQLADVSPGATTLGKQDPLPDIAGEGFGVRRPGSRPKPLQHLVLLCFLAGNGDQLTEAAQTLLGGDANLPSNLPRSLVDRPLQRPDRRHDAESQQQVLDVPSKPLADRRVADLRQTIAAIDVTVAGVHD